MSVNNFDDQYHNLVRKILQTGFWKTNKRTNQRCLTVHGEMMKFNLADGFPLLTTKKMFYKQMAGELLAFIRAEQSAKGFRDLKCKFWDKNANESVGWLTNPNRKGEDDLGRIYGVQARQWISPVGREVDQLKEQIEKLRNRDDDRRMVVTHWNPGELDQMALPPCHMFYQMSIRSDQYLDMTMYQRSCDVPLGVPMNIASYALLTEILAKITGLKSGIFTHMLGDVHIYENQLEAIKLQQMRSSYAPPRLVISKKVDSLKYLETDATIDDFEIVRYKSHPVLRFPFAA